MGVVIGVCGNLSWCAFCLALNKCCKIANYGVVLVSWAMARVRARAMARFGNYRND